MLYIKTFSINVTFTFSVVPVHQIENEEGQNTQDSIYEKENVQFDTQINLFFVAGLCILLGSTERKIMTLTDNDATENVQKSVFTQSMWKSSKWINDFLNKCAMHVLYPLSYVIV